MIGDFLMPMVRGPWMSCGPQKRKSTDHDLLCDLIRTPQANMLNTILIYFIGRGREEERTLNTQG